MGIDLDLWYGDKEIALSRNYEDHEVFNKRVDLMQDIPEDFPKPQGIGRWPCDGYGDRIQTLTVGQILEFADELTNFNYARIVGELRRSPKEDRVVLLWR